MILLNYKLLLTSKWNNIKHIVQEAKYETPIDKTYLGE